MQKPRENSGHKKEVLSLSERTFHCQNCGFEMNRDLNTAINLSRQALARKSTEG